MAYNGRCIYILRNQRRKVFEREDRPQESATC
jgi:hypothetical protein